MLKNKSTAETSPFFFKRLGHIVKLWLVLAAAAVLLAAGGITLLVLQRGVPADTGTLHGSSNLQVNYSLDYLPNDLYTQAQPGDKEARLLIYVKDIRFDLKYALLGLQGLPVQSVVSAQTQLVANATETNKYMDPGFIVWEKDETLLPDEKITLDRSGGFERTLTVDVSKYFSYAKDVYTKSQVQTTNELRLTFRVSTMVQGSQGPVSDTTTVTYTIPMLDNLLVVKGTPTVTNPVQLSSVPTARRVSLLPFALLCFALALGCGIAAVLRRLSLPKLDNENLFKKNVDKIFQQHGERLVRLENPLSYQQPATIPIDGIGEMVKIADEISQPVFYYRVDTAAEKKVEFYVFDSGRIYYMVMFGDMGKEPGISSGSSHQALGN